MGDFAFDVQDLAEMAFRYSPLFETVYSLSVHFFPELRPEHTPFRRRTADALGRLDTEVLRALYSHGRGWLPDFVTPAGVSIVADIAGELAALRATPHEVVERHFDDAYGGAPRPDVLRQPPGPLLERIAAALEAYWTACIEPWWPRMRAVLDADLAHRGRSLARGGAAGLFEDLDSRLSWSEGILTLTYPRRLPFDSVRIAGRGLVLQPSLFLRGAVTAISADSTPTIGYPARARGTVWEFAPRPAPAALVNLLGATRARLLLELDTPVSTGELARRFEVTSSAISQHLSALHACGLLNRAREGRSVLYFRSPLADALV
ncbi:ArsR/SmtB family transcription factor [Nonomuraea sp. NPDC050556]|uniref:ArsR/SmtB family transcription factor n=1 Tax=Nonomuraea sp. NPDC050556 TaxID=3364369 RepID=UPI003791E989